MDPERQRGYNIRGSPIVTANPIRIPVTDPKQEPISLVVSDTDRLFIVGSNGSGKSALIQHFRRTVTDRPVRLVTAHRQTYFSSKFINMNSQSRQQFETQLPRHETGPDARWTELLSDQRLNAILYDVLTLENKRSRDIANADNYRIEQHLRSSTKSIIAQLNNVFCHGNLSVDIFINDEGDIQAKHSSGDIYSLAQLSDGERNAVLLASTVFIVKPGTLLLIDEPERHLHRAIIEPLLTTLMHNRPDCPFIMSTHDLSLPMATPCSRILVLRSCDWENEKVKSWDIDELDASTDVPDDIKTMIIGARRKLVIVEGKKNSRDIKIYDKLFPSATVNAGGSCENVIRMVDGMRHANKWHWLKIYGLIDRDDRCEEEIEKLRERGIFALEVSSVEAMYYARCARESVAEIQKENLTYSKEDMLKDAIEKATRVLSEAQVREDLILRRYERRVREEIAGKVPKRKELKNVEILSVELKVGEHRRAEEEKYHTMQKAGDVDGIIERYAGKKSRVLDVIAAALHYAGREEYERAVLARLDKDAGLREKLCELVGGLSAEIEGRE